MQQKFALGPSVGLGTKGKLNLFLKLPHRYMDPLIRALEIKELLCSMLGM